MTADSDLRRVPSKALDDVVGYCTELYELHPEGRKPVDVSVTRKEREHCSTEEGSKLPISCEFGIVYVAERKGVHPIRREEAVAYLCAAPLLREELENPGFRTSCSTVVTEAKLQVLARLQRLLQLKDEGVVAKLTYSQRVGESTEVTREFLRELAGENEIPSEAYQIFDNFTVSSQRVALVE